MKKRQFIISIASAVFFILLSAQMCFAYSYLLDDDTLVSETTYTQKLPRGHYCRVVVLDLQSGEITAHKDFECKNYSYPIPRVRIMNDGLFSLLGSEHVMVIDKNLNEVAKVPLPDISVGDYSLSDDFTKLFVTIEKSEPEFTTTPQEKYCGKVICPDSVTLKVFFGEISMLR